MRSPARISFELLAFSLVAAQLSCGDSSGPGRVPASIDANSSVTLTAAPGTAVTELPSVLVRDAAGAPLSGAAVIFAVTSGGGVVTGANATTNSDGIATVGSWTLGTAAGTNTLTATSGSLPPVTFTASGFDPCTTLQAHSLGSTTNGQLSLSDCKLSDGSFADLYAVTTPATGTYVFNQTSPTFDTYLFLLTSAGTVIGVNDDFGAANTSVIKAILPAGAFAVAANSYDANITGSYTLSSSTSTAPITNCEDVFVFPGISSDQALQTSDCTATATGFLSDDYLIFLAVGQSLTVSMTSTVVDSYLELYTNGSPPALVASNDSKDGTSLNAQFVYTVPSTGFYFIKARSTAAGVTGPYTITVQ
ncbi:MAG TPA: Ig-like domain-containing protein [Gemmatimonadaceae bacterium]